MRVSTPLFLLNKDFLGEGNEYTTEGYLNGAEGAHSPEKEHRGGISKICHSGFVECLLGHKSQS